MESRLSARRPLPVTLRPFFGCSKCREGCEYMESAVVLPCLHSICTNCLRQRVTLSLSQEAVECPACGQRAPIPPGGLEAFPPDKFSRVAFKTLCDPEYIYVPGGPNPRCGLHPMEKISNYCHRCHVQVCGKCVSSTHNNHKAEIEEILVVANNMNHELVSALGRITEEVKKSALVVAKNQAEMDGELDQLRKKVIDRGRQIHEEVEKWTEYNLRKLHDIKQQLGQPLQQALEQLERKQSVLQQYKQYVDILGERGTDLDKTSHCPGMKELVEKLCPAQSENPRWLPRMVQLEEPLQKRGLLETMGNINTHLILFKDIERTQTAMVMCKYAIDIRQVTLFGQQRVLHSFVSGKNMNKICIHNTDGQVERLLVVPAMSRAGSSAVVNPAGGELVVADWGADKGTHTNGCLHWITVNRAYDVLEHKVIKVKCRPAGCINVDSNGQVLVITQCTFNQHPFRLVIIDKTLQTRPQVVINLPEELKYPLSAVRSVPDVFTVVDHKGNKVVWLDQMGGVLRTYGEEPEETMSGPRHIVQHSEGYLLISDYNEHRIHLLGRDGTFLQYLLSKDLHQVEYPRSIHLNEEAGLLTISCDGNTVITYAFRQHATCIGDEL